MFTRHAIIVAAVVALTTLSFLGYLRALKPNVAAQMMTDGQHSAVGNDSLELQSLSKSRGTFIPWTPPPLRKNATGPSRAFPPWDFDRRGPFPCYAEPKGTAYLHEYGDHTSFTPEGLLFTGVPKTGSSTVSGVALRIAHRQYRRGGGEGGNASSPLRDQRDDGMCKIRFRGYPSSVIRAGERNASRSFLFGFVRHPTSRAVSHFFHFKVSREKVEPTDENFLSYARGEVQIFTQFMCTAGDCLERGEREGQWVGVVKSIIEEYDFIGVTERMDESLVALALILGLDLGDVLYFPSKRRGGFDDGMHNDKCHYIVPPYVSPGMEQFFSSDEWTRNMMVGDFELYGAAQRSLDATIERLGKDVFAEHLAKYRVLMARVAEVCASRAIFPCTAGGERISETNCYLWDLGCGYPCLDKVSDGLI